MMEKYLKCITDISQANNDSIYLLNKQESKEEIINIYDTLFQNLKTDLGINVEIDLLKYKINNPSETDIYIAKSYADKEAYYIQHFYSEYATKISHELISKVEILLKQLLNKENKTQKDANDILSYMNHCNN